jgi:tetratricopeptide (TPR) repeat protein
MRQILCLLVVTACSQSAAPKPPAAPVPAPERFDDRVRADFFDGLRGDEAAMARAMKLCEDALAKDPKHAEAMVWHGAGIIARSRDAFRTGDKAHGIELYSKGLAEMDNAVTLAPDDVGVRIPRGAVLLAMAPFVPEPEKTKLLERGISDYERTYELQKDYFPKLTLHAREQLLYGLTDGYANLGKPDKAQTYFEQMKVAAAGSELLPRAASRAKGETVDGQAPCEQCHASR